MAFVSTWSVSCNIEVTDNEIFSMVGANDHQDSLVAHNRSPVIMHEALAVQVCER